MKKMNLFALGLASVYAIVGSIISVVRFWQYDVFYYDFSLFDKAIWSVSQFSSPVIDHMTLGEKIIFADHFSPTIFLLSPLFWIYPGSETLLVTQAFAVAVSGFLLFLIGQHLLKNNFYALSVMLMYFLFVGLQNAVITDFHEVTIATAIFMLIFWSFLKQKKKLFFLSFILLLGIKETMFLLGIGLGIAVFFLDRSWRKIALILIPLSLLWGILAIKVIIPFFSGGMYLYASNPPLNPISIVSVLFDTPVKQQTLFYSFASFGFLPLLSPAFWFLLFQDIFIRFFAPFPTRWELGFHYSALLAAIMGVSSVYSLRFLQTRIKQKYLTLLLVVVLINSLFLYRVTLRGPFALSYNPAFYTHTKDFSYLDTLLKTIPKDASVMTQNNIAPHFAHQKVWLLVSDKKLYPQEYYVQKQPDYILIDIREGQNPNNYFGVKDMPHLLNHLQKNKSYKLIKTDRNILIYKKV